MSVKLPGFHSYDQSLTENIDWCNMEMRRQKEQWEKIKKRAIYANIKPLAKKIAEIADESRAIHARMMLLPAANQTAVHVYRLRRNLLRSRNLLNQLTELVES